MQVIETSAMRKPERRVEVCSIFVQSYYRETGEPRGARLRRSTCEATIQDYHAETEPTFRIGCCPTWSANHCHVSRSASTPVSVSRRSRSQPIRGVIEDPQVLGR